MALDADRIEKEEEIRVCRPAGGSCGHAWAQQG
jgi:hypothetical protein